MLHNRRSNIGFTLLELVMVIVVLSVTAAIVMPRLMNSLPSRELKNAALELKFLLLETQQRAIAEGKIWAVAFDLGNGNYSLHYCNDEQYFTQSDATGTMYSELPDCEVGRDGSVEITATTFSQDLYYNSATKWSVRFNSLGMPNAGGTITLRHMRSLDTCVVAVTKNTGRITMTMS